MRIKVRAEMQLEVGDKVGAVEAALEAAKDWVEHLNMLAANPGDVTQPNIIDVTRGKMAFVIEKG
jgi:hypothetical protein